MKGSVPCKIDIAIWQAKQTDNFRESNTSLLPKNTLRGKVRSAGAPGSTGIITYVTRMGRA